MNENIEIYKQMFNPKNLEIFHTIFARIMRTNKYKNYADNILTRKANNLNKKYTMSDFKSLYEKFRIYHDLEILLYFDQFTIEIGKEIFLFDKDRDSLVVKDPEGYYYLLENCSMEEIIYLTFLYFDRINNINENFYRQKFDIIFPNNEVDNQIMEYRSKLDNSYKFTQLNFLSFTNGLIEIPITYVKDDNFRKENFNKYWKNKDYSRFNVFANKCSILRIYYCDIIKKNYEHKRTILKPFRIAQICSNCHNVMGIINDIKYDFNIQWEVKYKDYVNELHGYNDDLNGDYSFMYRLYKNFNQLHILDQLFITYYILLKKEFYQIFMKVNSKNKEKNRFIEENEVRLFYIRNSLFNEYEKLKEMAKSKK